MHRWESWHAFVAGSHSLVYFGKWFAIMSFVVFLLLPPLRLWPCSLWTAALWIYKSGNSSKTHKQNAWSGWPILIAHISQSLAFYSVICHPPSHTLLVTPTQPATSLSVCLIRHLSPSVSPSLFIISIFFGSINPSVLGSCSSKVIQLTLNKSRIVYLLYLQLLTWNGWVFFLCMFVCFWGHFEMLILYLKHENTTDFF